MKAQQIGQDIFLFFDRTGEKYTNGRIVGGELGNRPNRLETELLDFNEKPLGRKVVILSEQNDEEMGVEVSFASKDIVEVRLGSLAYGLLRTYNELFAPIPGGDGTCKILYSPRKS
ncbi:MAG: hypothetical protein AABX50_00245 [Nanoarchaeota archaeon]